MRPANHTYNRISLLLVLSEPLVHSVTIESMSTLHFFFFFKLRSSLPISIKTDLPILHLSFIKIYVPLMLFFVAIFVFFLFVVNRIVSTAVPCVRWLSQKWQFYLHQSAIFLNESDRRTTMRLYFNYINCNSIRKSISRSLMQFNHFLFDLRSMPQIDNSK